MEKSKEKLLNDTYQEFMEVGLGDKVSLCVLKNIVIEDVMGFGTTQDEKIFSLTDFFDLLKKQREQSEGHEMQWSILPIMRRIAADTNSAVFADELVLKIKVNDEIVKMDMRFSSVFEYLENRWKLVHWHGSKPENTKSETDTFGIEEWKQKNAKLEKLVQERTTELSEKNRELEIEAALERVRFRAMAMHKSKDLTKTVNVVFKELDKLGLNTIRCGIGIFDDQSNKVNVWTASSNDSKKIANLSGDEYLEGHPLLKGIYDNWRLQRDFSYTLNGNDLLEYYKITSKSNFPVEAPHLNTNIETQYYHCAMFPAGGLFAFRGTGFSDELKLLMKRFSEVFHLSFIRHQDLKKAEAQTREAQIEVALERVRAKGMSINNTSQFQEVTHTVAQQLHNMNLDITGVFIAINNQEIDKQFTFWGSSGVAETYLKRATIPFLDRPIYTVLAKGSKKNEGFFTEEYSREEKIEFFKHLFKNPPYNSSTPEWKDQVLSREGGYTRSVVVSLHTTIFVVNHNGRKLPDSDNEILKRFGKIFEQSYIRFLDIQKVEAQAREFQIEMAVERVRSSTLAMQSSGELVKTAVVVFKQLIDLGIEPNRIYIGIIKDKSNKIELWATDESGSKIGSKVEFDMAKNKSIAKIITAWKQDKKSLNFTIEGRELSSYLKYLNKELGIPVKQGRADKKRFQSIGFFSKGFIGVASPKEQPEETTNLLERFAAVFNLTYIRFNDLQIAEAHAVQAKEDLLNLQAEKKRAETALRDLQAAQKQLVQSEKMASLGELTAGIAHEIQNPLNFVNNFSEVSKELLDDLKIEFESGNIEDAKEIVHDVIENLKKINLHGKRAETIVRGMLQHSRNSTGAREIVNINKLTDEYLRLAYHGLRAKDKSFNATLNTDYDDSIGKIEIVPQDIGRVILNLIANALYAVNERKKLNLPDYQPIVSVSTKKLKDSVEIRVIDNGNGMSKRVLDKIFQPFFTTKPSGQGTGLGLSLSYDIIKAHGGEIKVKTKVSEGTEFSIKLPKN